MNRKSIITLQMTLNAIFPKSKKGIGPVVATALLVFLAIIAIVGFQGWFETYSSSIFVNTEKESNSNLNTGLEGVIGNELYFKNSNTRNIIINKIEIDGIDCNVSGNYSGSIINIDVSTCLNNLSTKTPEVVVITNDKIYSMKEYVKEIQISQSENETSTLIINNLLLTSNNGSGTDYLNGVDVDSFGNMYIVGKTNSDLNFGNGVTMSNDGDTDFYLVKYNDKGIAQFVKTSEAGSGNASDSANDIKLDNEGNIYVVGRSSSNLDFGDGFTIINNGEADFFLVKYDKNGIVQFVKTSETGTGLAYDNALDLEVDSLGNIYVSGYCKDDINFGNGIILTYSGTYNSNFFLVKYDNNGIAQFVKSGVSEYGNTAKGLTIDSLGNIYLVGTYYKDFDLGQGYVLTYDGGYSDFFLVKYNSSGDIQFVKTNNIGSGEALESIEEVEVDTLGNIYIVGNSYGSLDFGNGVSMADEDNSNFFLVKYDNNGVAQFIKTSESSDSGADYAYGVDIDSSGDIYVVGMTYNSLNFGNGITMSNDGSRDFFLIKYDVNGVPLYVKTSENESGSKIDYALKVFIDDLDYVYLQGYTESDLDFGDGNILSNYGSYDFFLYKYIDE